VWKTQHVSYNRCAKRTASFDATISIAVLHQISTNSTLRYEELPFLTKVLRLWRYYRELARIVRVGGEIYIVAWAFEQEAISKRQFDEQDVLVEWKLQEKYTQPVQGDTAVVDCCARTGPIQPTGRSSQTIQSVLYAFKSRSKRVGA
jgi:hypothetical protein